MPAAIPLAIGGSAVVGALAANNAASTQADAANRASDMQWNQFNKNQQNLQPYMDLGSSAINPLLNAMGYNVSWQNNPVAQSSQPVKGSIFGNGGWLPSLINGGGAGAGTGQTATLTKDPNNILNQQFHFDASNLDQTPGYQFALQQGLQGVNNSAAAKGLGVSSANMRDATRFATGLADQTYGDQFNRALNTYQTNYNSAANNAARMAGLVQMGQNAAAGVGNMGLQTAMNSGNLLTTGAAAQSAGDVGGANALSSGLNSYLNYSMMNNLMSKMGQGSMYGGTPSVSNVA